jgi:hypothetical protein
MRYQLLSSGRGGLRLGGRRRNINIRPLVSITSPLFHLSSSSKLLLKSIRRQFDKKLTVKLATRGFTCVNLYFCTVQGPPWFRPGLILNDVWKLPPAKNCQFGYIWVCWAQQVVRHTSGLPSDIRDFQPGDGSELERGEAALSRLRPLRACILHFTWLEVHRPVCFISPLDCNHSNSC